MRSKDIHELWASKNVVSIKSYRGYNRVHTSELFKDDLKQRYQRISYSGVGARSQNGITERAMQTIFYV